MKDMMTNENLLMDHNTLRWVAQPNHNSLNNGKVETHMADHLFVGAACEESKPKLWKNTLRPSWTFSSCWGIWFWMDPGFRTKNSCFATSYPGPRLYALLVKGVALLALVRRRLQLLKVDSSTSSLSFKLCRPQPLSIFIKLLKNKYTLLLNYF